jgi:glycosyltransferase involved in cell wall biosynthesis
MQVHPFVTVVVPCRNEERCIWKALASLRASDYSEDRFEILVVDGRSDDRTAELVAEFAALHSGVRLLDNPKKYVAAGMNVGIRNARGDVIMKADAHALYPGDFIRKCVEHLIEYDVDNVGGVCAMVPIDESTLSRAIAAVLMNPLAAGNAPHVCPQEQTPHLADTAAFGCYRRQVFDRIGFYNEEIVRGSDMDLNVRLRKAGGKILLVPDIVLQYYPRPAFWEFVVRQFYVGYWVIFAAKFGGVPTRPRHLVPLTCLTAYIGLLALGFALPRLFWAALALAAAYAAIVIGMSSWVAFVHRDPKLLIYLPALFAVRHWIYATGSLVGLCRGALSRRFWATVFAGGSPQAPHRSRLLGFHRRS